MSLLSCIQFICWKLQLTGYGLHLLLQHPDSALIRPPFCGALQQSHSGALSQGTAIVITSILTEQLEYWQLQLQHIAMWHQNDPDGALEIKDKMLTPDRRI